MSRHKFIKAMNLDDELDTFDGGGELEDGEGLGGYEEMSDEDKEQLRQGTAKVREVLGPDVLYTEKEIQDSLWHYYYDVGKTVNYLLNQKSTSQPKKTKKVSDGEERKANGGSSLFLLHPLPTICCGNGPFNVYSGYAMFVNGYISHEDSSGQIKACTIPFSAADFFRDSPWLNIPLDRRSEITIEPLYPRGLLLGGSSNEVVPKVSKLAALAAARKRKENEKINNTSSNHSASSISLLDKLSIGESNSDTSKNGFHPTIAVKPQASESQGSASGGQTRKYPTRRRRSPTPIPSVETVKERPVNVESKPLESALITASPSAFALTMLGSTPRHCCTSSEELRPNIRLFKSSFIPDEKAAKSNPFTGPSPDDIVAKAQTSKGPKTIKSPTKSIASDKALNSMTNELNKVVIEEPQRAKSKNLNVVAEFEKSNKKKSANFVVIGHVDAGKSTLMGRLLYDLKVIDQRTIDKYKKEADSIGKSSFALAWVLDQGTEERNRGVTIDIAMNKFETEKTSFTILDAPGHRDFIPNMIAGASQADFAVLVIDSSTGSFESGLRGQTKEHALLVRSIGVQRLIVAINKLDTIGWSKDRFEEIEQQVSAFLTSAGFQPKSVSYIPCSGLTGDNVARRATDAKASWYVGPILVEQLESSEPVARALGRPLRLTIGDIFRGGVQNPLSISGRIDAGSAQVGDRVIAMPSNETAYIKGIEVDQEPGDWAVAGQNVTLHLTDIDSIHLKSGDVICPPLAPIRNITTFTTKILAFDHVIPMHVEVHRGRLHVPGRITQLVAVLDKSSGATVKRKPKLVQPGSVARVIVELEQAVPLEAPGRVVLRAGGETVAAGLLE